MLATVTIITPQESRVILSVGGHTINFLLDTGTSYSVLLHNPGPPSSQSTTVSGVSGKPMTKYFTQPLSCEWDSVLLSHAFLVVPESPTPLLGRDILSKIQASVHMNKERSDVSS